MPSSYFSLAFNVLAVVVPTDLRNAPSFILNSGRTIRMHYDDGGDVVNAENETG